MTSTYLHVYICTLVNAYIYLHPSVPIYTLKYAHIHPHVCISRFLPPPFAIFCSAIHLCFALFCTVGRPAPFTADGQVLRTYYGYIGSGLVVAVVLGLVLNQGSKNANDWWLLEWTQQAATSSSSSSSSSPSVPSSSSFDAAYFLRVLLLIGGANIAFSLFRAFSFAYVGIQVHREMQRGREKRGQGEEEDSVEKELRNGGGRPAATYHEAYTCMCVYIS